MKKNNLNTEKDLAKIVAEIKKQGLNSEEELRGFLENAMGENMEGVFDDDEPMDDIGKAQELVYEAFDLPITKAKKNIKKALELDPNNTEAYNFLANNEKNIDKAIILYEKGIEGSIKSLGEKFFQEEKGYFWGMIETRPFMRAKASLADCLFAKGKIDKALEIYEEMIELNPNDNQGIRYLLSTLYLCETDLTKFENFIKNWEEEGTAVWTYNNAYYHYRKFGNTAKSNKVLLEAYNSNKFVIDLLLGKKKMPNHRPQYVGFGDESEAISYVFGNSAIWVEEEGAIEWLFNFMEKRKKNELIIDRL